MGARCGTLVRDSNSPSPSHVRLLPKQFASGLRSLFIVNSPSNLLLIHKGRVLKPVGPARASVLRTVKDVPTREHEIQLSFERSNGKNHRITKPKVEACQTNSHCGILDPGAGTERDQKARSRNEASERIIYAGRRTYSLRFPIGRWPSADSGRPGVARGLRYRLHHQRSVLRDKRVCVRTELLLLTRTRYSARTSSLHGSAHTMVVSVRPRIARSREICFLEWQTLNGDWLYRADRSCIIIPCTPFMVEYTANFFHLFFSKKNTVV